MATLVVSNTLENIQVGATGVTSIAQQIRTLLNTRKGSVPLDRDFGISWDCIDQPVPEARQVLVSEIAQALKTYVPSVTLKSIEFSALDDKDAADGRMKYSVTVEYDE